jgi:hypothetical protein
MSKQDAIEDLIQRLAAARGAADELGLDHAVYLLNVAMLAVVERETFKSTLVENQSPAIGTPN